MDYNT